jgi:hypothetical protein
VQIDPAKTQGFVIRGYGFRFTRYLPLTVKDPVEARAFIHGLVLGGQDWPRITTAEQWAPPKPNHCLNIGFTYPGLEILGVPQESLDSFRNSSDHFPFYNGAVAQAGVVGDVGASAPPWRIDDRQFHVMLILSSADRGIVDADEAELRPMLAKGFEELAPGRVLESQMLDDGFVHFGYKDGIAQPHIAGVSYIKDPDGGQLLADPGYFMLGTSADQTYRGPPVPVPQQLGLYGCFGAFRLLKQDVDGFESQVDALAGDPTFISYSKIGNQDLRCRAVKALICGRWPNGTPLAVFPVQGDAEPPILNDDELNNFLYVRAQGGLPDGDPSEGPGGSSQYPNVLPDSGANCPIGSHIRRGNMRGWPDADTPAVFHRIMRRAAAYQAPYDPEHPKKGELGLLGFFMGSSLAAQFEFVQQNWINNTNGFAGVTDTNDPAMGMNADPGVPFTETLGGGRSDAYTLQLQSFVTTEGSAYCFFPGMDGIAWIGRTIAAAPAEPTPSNIGQ